MNIFIDIETLPDLREGAEQAARDRIKVPASYKKELSIEKYRKEHGTNAWKETALNGVYGELFCVCIDTEGDYGLMLVSRDSRWEDLSSETSLLHELNDKVLTILNHEQRRPTFIGHNVEFDLRFLFHRFVVHGIKPKFCIPYNERPWNGHMFDTQYAWCGANKYISLKELCAILGIQDVANDIDGSEVWDAVQEGRLKEVELHCEMDVKRVREVWKRLTFRGN